MHIQMSRKKWQGMINVWNSNMMWQNHMSRVKNDKQKSMQKIDL